MQAYKYRSVLYKDYYQNQSGRAFQQQIKDKMLTDEKILSAEILPLIPSDKTIRLLDIGCGFGSLIMTLKKKGYTHLKGIDLSESQVKVAHELGLPEVELQELTSFLKANPAAFDVITGVDILEHFGKDELIDLLEILKSSLKPGGIAIFRTPNLDAPFATVFANGDFTHENYMNGSSAQQLFMSMGFEQVQVHPSYMAVSGTLKELFRKITWFFVKSSIRLVLFATARSAASVIMTPNMLIRVQRPR